MWGAVVGPWNTGCHDPLEAVEVGGRAVGGGATGGVSAGGVFSGRGMLGRLKTPELNNIKTASAATESSRVTASSFILLCACEESDLDLGFRKPTLYPLSYRRNVAPSIRHCAVRVKMGSHARRIKTKYIFQ